MPTNAESKLTSFLRKAFNDETRAARWIKGSIEDDIFLVEEAAEKAEKAKATDILYLAWSLKRALTQNLINENRLLLSLRGLFLVSSRIDSVSGVLKASQKETKAFKDFADENGALLKRIKELYQNSGNPQKKPQKKHLPYTI
jgi:hypothetical protein